jgi:hypothetical protein
MVGLIDKKIKPKNIILQRTTCKPFCQERDVGFKEMTKFESDNKPGNGMLDKPSNGQQSLSKTNHKQDGNFKGENCLVTEGKEHVDGLLQCGSGHDMCK